MSSPAKCSPLTDVWPERIKSLPPNTQEILGAFSMPSDGDTQPCEGQRCTSCIHLTDPTTASDVITMLTSPEVHITKNNSYFIEIPLGGEAFARTCSLLGVSPEELSVLSVDPRFHSIFSKLLPTIRNDRNYDKRLRAEALQKAPLQFLADIAPFLAREIHADDRAASMYRIMFCALSPQFVANQIEVYSSFLGQEDAEKKQLYTNLLMEMHCSEDNVDKLRLDRLRDAVSTRGVLPDPEIKKTLTDFIKHFYVDALDQDDSVICSLEFDHRLLGLIKGARRDRFCGFEHTSLYAKEYGEYSVADMVASAEQITQHIDSIRQKAEEHSQHFDLRRAQGALDTFTRGIKVIQTILDKTRDLDPTLNAR